MKLPIFAIKFLISESLINEIDIKDVQAIKCVAGSTHVMNTCLISGDRYYLKFSDESLFDKSDPSLQILVEYLAYKVYELYPSISVPKVHLVYDKSKKRVGLSTSEVKGKQALTSLSANQLGKMLSAGVYVDIFLANWDVIGTGSGNIIVGNNKATRIDPGGALTFRAQGGRKYEKFGKKASELSTMLDPSFGGAGKILSYSDMMIASKEFMSVAWSQINATLMSVNREIKNELQQRNMSSLLQQWEKDFSEILEKLQFRHKEITSHIKKTQEL